MLKEKRNILPLIIIVSGHGGEEGDKDELRFSEAASRLQIELLEVVEMLSKTTDGCMACGVLSMIGTTMANLFYLTNDADELSSSLEGLIAGARKHAEDMHVKTNKLNKKEAALAAIYAARQH